MEHFVVDAQPWARVGGYRVVVVAVVVVLLLRAVGSDGAVSICFKNRNRKRPKKKREARMKSIEQPAEFEQLWEDGQRKCQLTN